MKLKDYLFFAFSLILLFLISCSTVQKEKKFIKKLDVYPVGEQNIKNYLDSNKNNLDPIEGIWSISFEYLLPNGRTENHDNQCRAAIIKSNYINGHEFIEITFSDAKNSFIPGSITAYFNSSSYESIYTSTQLSPDGSQSNANFNIDEYGLLNGTKEIYLNGEKIISKWHYLKLFPKFNGKYKSTSRDTTSTNLKGTGSGFLISNTGLVVTNYHVVVDGSRLDIAFPNKGITKKAKVKMKDMQNDIAILEIENFTPSEVSISSVPFNFAENSSVKVGQEVFTLGFPFGDIMGTTPRLATGNINSLYGLQDDPRLYQINNAIQPGNSGGALFNKKGELVGICVSGLNAKYFYENQGIIPQNMNFAIKASYLKNLISMVPEGDEILKRINSVKQGAFEEQIEQLNPFIVQIRVY